MKSELIEAPPLSAEEAREGWQKGHGDHPLDRYLKPGRIPHIWCAGCGIGIAFTAFIKALEESGAPLDKTVVVSGIGCSGRAAGYLQRLVQVNPQEREAQTVLEMLGRGAGRAPGALPAPPAQP